MRGPLLQILIFFIPIHFLLAQTAAQITMDSLRVEYIRKFKDIAMEEMERSGVPASIKLAQGILESRAGTSELAIRGSNHFGIKCGKGWTGETIDKHDDAFNKRGQPVNSCFRKYRNVVECFADHSEFIRNPEKHFRYGFLFELDPLDYKAWAKGLQSAGYSSAGHYAEKLIYFIELHDLARFDKMVLDGRSALVRMAEVNGAKMVQARTGETLRTISKLYNLPIEKLVAYNDDQISPEQTLSIGAWVYMQPKNDSWAGTAEFHSVEPNQTLFDIAQRYGIRLESLRARNGLLPGQEPAAYEYIRLRGVRAMREKVLIRPVDNFTKNSQAKSPDRQSAGKTNSRSIEIEMMPDEKLERPILAESASASTSPAANTIQMLDLEPEPLIIIDTQTGESQIYHTVQKGDTLYKIARRFEVSPARIRQLNQMPDNLIRIGQSLRVF